MRGRAQIPRQIDVHVPVGDLSFAVAPGAVRLSLGDIAGVQILVLLRHRH